MTAHVYDIVERFRNLGGRLDVPVGERVLLEGRASRDEDDRVKLWRTGQAGGALLGAQYRANDDGSNQGAYHVVAARRCRGSSRGRGSEGLDNRRGDRRLRDRDRREDARLPAGNEVVAVIPISSGRASTAR